MAKSYPLSRYGVTSIRLDEGNIIRATICFNEKEYIIGKFDKDEFIYEIILKNHMITDARYVEDKFLTLSTQGESSKTKIVACIQDLKGDRTSRSIFPKRQYDRLKPRISDVSVKGVVLSINPDGLVHLRDSNNSTFDYELTIGMRYANNQGSIGLLIPRKVGHSIIFAGARYKELNITNVAPELGRISDIFDWEPERNDRKNSISSIDYYKDFIVLGLRRSVIVFKLDSERGAPKEPDKLREVLQEYHKDGSSTEEAECVALDHDTGNTYTKSASESGKESADTSDTEMEFESESESNGTQHSNARDSEMHSTSDSGENQCGSFDKGSASESEPIEAQDGNSSDNEMDSASSSGENPCERLGKDTRATKQEVTDQAFRDIEHGFKKIKALMAIIRPVLRDRPKMS